MARMALDERKAQITAIAAKEFAHSGLHGTSIETIARKADISQPYVFRLFLTKRQLFLHVLEEAYDRTVEVFTNAAHGLEGPEALRAMGRCYDEMLADNTFLLLQLQGFAACGDPEVRVAVARCFQKLWTAVQTLSGMDNVTVKRFMAVGMLLNDIAAMDLKHADTPWAGVVVNTIAGEPW